MAELNLRRELFAIAEVTQVDGRYLDAMRIIRNLFR